MPWRSVAVALACLSAVVLAACGSGRPPARLAEGEPLPPVTLVGLDGQPRPVADYRGKVLVLNVWATWCGPCRAELPSLQRLADRLDPGRYVVLGLSVDQDEHLVHEFLRERQVRFANFIDRDGAIVRDQVGVQVFPCTFLVGPDGVVRQVIAGGREWDSPEMVRLIESVRALE